MLRPWMLLLGLVLLGLPLSDAAAQQQRCQQVLPADFRRIINEVGQEIFYFRDPVRMVCTGGVQLEADSAVMNRSASTLEMVGRVLYRDGDRQLTSDWARYLGATDDLFARGNVVVTDLADGSVITGDDFEYHPETEARPESRMIMRGERPHARLRPAREAAPAADPDTPGVPGAPGADTADDATPVLVWARRMEMVGEAVFIAQDDVELERGEMRGNADMVRFDQAAERFTMTGRAHIESEAYRLEGQRIEADVRGDTLREVRADREGRLLAEELTVLGERIRIGFVDGEVDRVEAWQPRPLAAVVEGVDVPEVGPAAPAATARRAVAISDDFQLRADSIDARSDAGRLREVRAIGRAYGEREADSLSVHLPDEIARDWIQGDTITGYFMDEPALAESDPAVTGSAGEDGADERTVLERIEVIGGSSHALSLYRTESEDGVGGPSVNFMRASRIILYMAEGEVDRVEADGPLDGIYIDPVREPQPLPDTPDAGTRIAS